jgi:hypothetical protein
VHSNKPNGYKASSACVLMSCASKDGYHRFTVRMCKVKDATLEEGVDMIGGFGPCGLLLHEARPEQDSADIRCWTCWIEAVKTETSLQATSGEAAIMANSGAGRQRQPQDCSRGEERRPGRVRRHSLPRVAQESASMETWVVAS